MRLHFFKSVCNKTNQFYQTLNVNKSLSCDVFATTVTTLFLKSVSDETNLFNHAFNVIKSLSCYILWLHFYLKVYVIQTI